MPLDVEYAIKKDVRNNPIVREIDGPQKRELMRTLGLAGLVVAMLLFSAWQHFEILNNGYLVSQLQRQLNLELSTNRRLRLEVESWRTPEYVEQRATEQLHMVAPDPSNTLVIERATPGSAPPARAIVAQTR